MAAFHIARTVTFCKACVARVGAIPHRSNGPTIAIAMRMTIELVLFVVGAAFLIWVVSVLRITRTLRAAPRRKRGRA